MVTQNRVVRSSHALNMLPNILKANFLCVKNGKPLSRALRKIPGGFVWDLADVQPIESKLARTAIATPTIVFIDLKKSCIY